MRRFFHSVLYGVVIPTIVFLSIPFSTHAESVCCKCTPQMDQPPTLCYTAETLKSGENCSTLPDEYGLAGLICDSKKLDAAQCKRISGSGTGVCTSDPESVNSVRKGETVASSPAEELPSLFPTAINFNTPIPGFAPSGDMGLLFGNYIVAIYRYMISIGIFVTTVMFIWGAFRYLVGSGIGGVSRGKTIMKDAVIGLLLVLSANLILRTINPELVSLQNLNIGNISSKYFEDIQPTGTVYDSQSRSTVPVLGKSKGNACLSSTFGSSDSEVRSQLTTITFLGDRYFVQQKAAPDFQAALNELERSPSNSPVGKWVQHMKNMAPYNAQCGKSKGYAEAGSRTGGSYIQRLDAKIKKAAQQGKSYCMSCDLHALGLAIDFDSCFNPMCPSGETCTLTDSKYNTIPLDVVNVFARHNIYWGGYGWTARGMDWNAAVPGRDAMHFEWHGICW